MVSDVGRQGAHNLICASRSSARRRTVGLLGRATAGMADIGQPPTMAVGIAHRAMEVVALLPMAVADALMVEAGDTSAAEVAEDISVAEVADIAVAAEAAATEVAEVTAAAIAK